MLFNYNLQDKCLRFTPDITARVLLTVFFLCSCPALHTEGSLPERGDSSEPGAGGEAPGAGGEVPAVRRGAGALLWHVWRVHRGQGPKAAVLALFPHLPSQVGDRTLRILAFYYF